MGSVKIGAVFYGVEYVQDLQDHGCPLDGQIEYNQANIKIKANMDEQIQVQALLHEVIHGINAQAAIPAMKETTIDALAYGIYQVMRDNPELVRMITKG
jgi:hypothetical protein